MENYFFFGARKKKMVKIAPTFIFCANCQKWQSFPGKKTPYLWTDNVQKMQNLNSYQYTFSVEKNMKRFTFNQHATRQKSVYDFSLVSKTWWLRVEIFGFKQIPTTVRKSYKSLFVRQGPLQNRQLEER